MASRKEETVRLLTECIIDTSNDMSRYRTEMEAAFRGYEEEDIDLSKLDRLKEALTDQNGIIQSIKEAVDRQYILLLRRSKAGRENMVVRNDSGIHSGGDSFIAQESEEPINPVRRRAMLFSMSLVTDEQMPEQETESGASSTDQTNQPVIDESR